MLQWKVEGPIVCYNDIYKNISRCKSSSFANGQHGGTFLNQEDGGYPQPTRFF